MRILHTVSGIWKHTGGPAEVIPLLCQNLRSLNNNVAIATLEGDMAEAVSACQQQGVVIHKFPVTFRSRPWFSRALRAGLRELVGSADIVHGNGMWEYINWCTGAEAIRQRKPYMLSFHGSVMHPAVNWHRRHRIAWGLLDGRYVRRAACLHACTETELKCIRQLGVRNPVAVVPNAVQIWPQIPPDRIGALIPEFGRKKTALFLSRIHPSKGVYELVDTWSSLQHGTDAWQLVIAGPGQPDHVEKLTAMIETLELGHSIIYRGPLYDQERVAAFQSCDVFVFPSHTENFGVVVGEALACGKPVVATQNVPWPELTDRKCGWWVPDTPKGLREGIQDSIRATDTEREVMGQQGRELVMERYNWPKIARQMNETYEWVLGGGSTPYWVDLA